MYVPRFVASLNLTSQLTRIQIKELWIQKGHPAEDTLLLVGFYILYVPFPDVPRFVAPLNFTSQLTGIHIKKIGIQKAHLADTGTYFW
jgi:hypothetical protein